jgi:hypothetical protein
MLSPYKRLFLALLFVPAFAALAQTTSPTAVVTWAAPIAYTSGTLFPAGTVVTYNLYQGTQVGTATPSLIKVQVGLTAPTATVTTGLTPGTTQCFAATALVAGIESAQSNQACAAIPNPVPNAPNQITVVIH